MKPVWGHSLHEQIDPLVLSYCSGRDVTGVPMADGDLLPHDLDNTEAHNIMLHRQGILSREEIRLILTELQAIRSETAEGGFVLEPEREDVHMNVEARLSERCGPAVGQKVHTGRSRNDQVACDMRLYLRERVLDLAEAVAGLAAALLTRAGEHTRTVMPGFSHTRHATVSTVAHLLSGYTQALLRDLERLGFSFSLINRNPLGAAAGYGTSWPIDRTLTTRLLGFDDVLENTLDCVSSRWEMESQLAADVSLLMNHLSQMAQDLILFSTTEFALVSLPGTVVQGSSIMPQKRNPDPLEVTRAKTAYAQGALQTLMALPRGGLSGYNRDLQYSKYVIMDLLRECGPAPAVMARVVTGLHFHAERAGELAREEFLNAVDVADHLAREHGLPFRRAYAVAADAVGRSQDTGRLTVTAVNDALRSTGLTMTLTEEEFAPLADPLQTVARRAHIGGPAPDAVSETLTAQRRALEAHSRSLKDRRDRLEQARQERARQAEELMR